MIRAAALLLGAVPALVGCAALRPAERIDTMRLAPRFGAVAPARPGGVAVSPVEAAGAVADRRYVYVLASDPLLLRRAATLFWELPPPATVGRALTDALGARFAGMAGGPVVGRLSARLVRFEEVAGGERARAVVAVEASFAPAGAGVGPATAGRYCRAVPIAGDGGGERAAAFQASVAAVAAAVADDVSAGRLTLSDC